MLIRNNPWQLLSDLNSILDAGQSPRVKDDTQIESSRWIPEVDIKEEAERFILTIDLPGVNPKDVEIFMDNNVLTLKGSREETAKEEKLGYHREERIKGAFYRRFALPDTADAEKVTAKSRHGVLEVTIGKKSAKQTRKIAVVAHE